MSFSVVKAQSTAVRRPQYPFVGKTEKSKHKPDSRGLSQQPATRTTQSLTLSSPLQWDGEENGLKVKPAR